MLTDYHAKYFAHELTKRCASDSLEKLAGAVAGAQVDARFVVLRDKDSEDCREVKNRLVKKCAEGLRPDALVRVACHELESWYLGDLAAVEAGLQTTGLARHQHKTPFDKPDDLASPARKLQSIAPAYQKIGGSRAIGPHLDPVNKRSHSFVVFVDGLRKLAAP